MSIDMKLVVDAVRGVREAYAMDVGYMQAMGEKYAHVNAAICAAKFIARVGVCAVRGHRVVDVGHAGPESGCIDLVCERCGYSHGRTYLY